eukprot:TRINITY_DN3822_c0_g1_i5.p1 TRINITY_DN3822_c0_g1~~TRINITY_DN3822_c0_g1_i5.p1  ORF type:complete len:798 (+),score=161.61 TRINITY_DN3822_c0_g1_i5:2322-4715(+)
MLLFRLRLRLRLRPFHFLTHSSSFFQIEAVVSTQSTGGLRTLMQVYLLLAFVLFATCFAKERSTSSQCDKIEVTTTILPNSTIDEWQLFYLQNTKIVFVRVVADRKGQIYRSSDYGKSWVKQTDSQVMPHYDQDGISSIYYDDSGGVSTMYFMSTDSKKMWVTPNGGLNYTFVSDLPYGIRQILVHKSSPDTALAVQMRQYDEALYLVTEYGKTWTMMTSVPQNSRVLWSPFPEYDPNGLYVENRSSTNPHTSLVYSSDWFKTWKKLEIFNVTSWGVYPSKKMFAITCVDDLCMNRSLQISEDAGGTWKIVSFPDNLKESNVETNIVPYELIDDIIWVNVIRYCHPTSHVCYGDLYHSDDNEKDFTLSTRRIRIGDFSKYNSLDGIYVANQIISPNGDVSRVRTIISYNKGGDWSLLKAPLKDSSNKPTNCLTASGCGLHLHGPESYTDSYWDSLYSVPNALGVMLANGNLGSELAASKDQSNFFFSRNGGFDWKEVKQGRHIMEIGNLGTALVGASIPEETNEIVYSINDGKDWKTCQFSPAPISVNNIRVSSSWESSEFVLYGHSNNDAYLVHLNFGPAYSGKCSEKDFEEWSPSEDNRNCFMGRKTVYQRRAYGKSCFLDEQHATRVSQSSCPCATFDYECSECFYRQTFNGTCTQECIPVASMDSPPPIPPPSCSSSTPENPLYFEVDFGYRLVDSTGCDMNLAGAVKPPKGLASCEIAKMHQSASSMRTILAILVVVALLVLAGSAFYFWKKKCFGHCPVLFEVPTDQPQHYHQLQADLSQEDTDEALSGST